MTKHFSRFIFLLTAWVLSMLVVGCGGSPEVAQPAISGPSFVLFFTDN